MPIMIEGVPKPSEDAKIFWKALDDIAFGSLTAEQARERALRALLDVYAVTIKPHERPIPGLETPDEIRAWACEMVNDYRAILEFWRDHGND